MTLRDAGYDAKDIAPPVWIDNAGYRELDAAIAALPDGGEIAVASLRVFDDRPKEKAARYTRLAEKGAAIVDMETGETYDFSTNLGQWVLRNAEMEASRRDDQTAAGRATGRTGRPPAGTITERAAERYCAALLDPSDTRRQPELAAAYLKCHPATAIRWCGTMEEINAAGGLPDRFRERLRALDAKRQAKHK